MIPLLPFSALTQLIPLETVRSMRGLSGEAIMEDVDSGKLRFVWDVSVKGERATVREWRFWLLELTAPTTIAELSPSAGIARILGEHRKIWRGTEIAQMLLVSRPHIHRLNRCRELPAQKRGHTLYINRPAMERFLTRRLYPPAN